MLWQLKRLLILSLDKKAPFRFVDNVERGKEYVQVHWVIADRNLSDKNLWVVEIVWVEDLLRYFILKIIRALMIKKIRIVIIQELVMPGPEGYPSHWFLLKIASKNFYILAIMLKYLF